MTPDQVPSIEDVEALFANWTQLREAGKSEVRPLHLPDPGRILRDLEKLLVGPPPEGLPPEIAEIWHCHADHLATPEAAEEMRRDFSELEAGLTPSDKDCVEKTLQLDALRARCDLLEQLAQVLDRLAGLAPPHHEIDETGDMP
jgi:hypothetical protein